ncbi:TetR/AcrR family transcriptional regulator [Psychrobacter phenylpyruvicus]|uniref:Rut operon repressor n=1 Tax=Psychrobacter phenylpyruvicus TaxID=29432 RepID=A0A379LKQ4_9GAMM|nr:TetR/AcrR family transcriptional regulator [Psychrobacter phenylpyruvicus]SUD91143.1 Rut operon repressor [Psychrobacter phenylpyruvicus]
MKPTTVKSHPKRSEQKRARETKCKILNAALKEFSAAGFEGVSTRAIASTAGVNHTLITHHFGTKEDLWKAAAEAIFDTYTEQSEKYIASLGDLEQPQRVRELLKHYINFSAEFPDFHRFMIQANRGDSELLNWFTDQYIKPYSDSELDLLKQAQKLGLMPRGDSLHVRYLFMGAVTSIFTFAPQFKRLSGTDPFSKDIVEKHIDYIFTIFAEKDHQA